MDKKTKIFIMLTLIIILGIGSIVAINVIPFDDIGDGDDWGDDDDDGNGDDDGDDDGTDVDPITINSLSWTLLEGQKNSGTYYGTNSIELSGVLLEQSAGKIETSFTSVTDGSIFINLYLTTGDVNAKLTVHGNGLSEVVFEQSPTTMLNQWLSIEIRFDLNEGTYTTFVNNVGRFSGSINLDYISELSVYIPFNSDVTMDRVCSGGLCFDVPDVELDNYLYLQFIKIEAIPY